MLAVNGVLCSTGILKSTLRLDALAQCIYHRNVPHPRRRQRGRGDRGDQTDSKGTGDYRRH